MLIKFYIRDLAVILYQKLGNWFKVIELLKSSSSLLGISGLTLNLAWQGIGDHFLDNQQWCILTKYINLNVLYFIIVFYFNFQGLSS